MSSSKQHSTGSATVVWPNDHTLPAEWRLAPFESIATLKKRRVAVEPTTRYRMIGMRWYAKGAYIKEELIGKNIKSEFVYSVAKGDFIYNRLFAWKGSFGVIDTDCQDGHVSGEFPCFETALPEDAYYLWYLFSQPWTWLILEGRSSGSTSTSRLRLKEDDLRKFLIPIPPESLRRKMVSDIGARLHRVEMARIALESQSEAIEALPQSVIRNVFLGA